MKKTLAFLAAAAIVLAGTAFASGLVVPMNLTDEQGVGRAIGTVTNNHPILTGKIVLGHRFETLDYYTRLDLAEVEGQLFKAVAAKNIEKVRMNYQNAIKARVVLASTEGRRL